MALAINQGMNEINTYSSLSSETSGLEADYSDSSGSLYGDSVTFEKINSNQDQMQAHQQNIQTFNSLIILTLLIEGYLTWDSLTMDERNQSFAKSSFSFHPAIKTANRVEPPGPGFRFSYHW